MIILIISLVFFISAYTFARFESEPFFAPQSNSVQESIEDSIRTAKAERF
ncbi:MAG: hypothetical protein KA116_05270 [Proteobacteria bacterium]|nr:hypothetical protein [Pseudomonadota bacterium]